MCFLVQKSKFKVKMAPISEKRPQPPNTNQIKENGHTSHGHGHTHLHTHTKENASSNTSGGKNAGVKTKGLEILDFHESWLEEVELYKDKLYVQKNLLLSSHNHAHTPHGCKIDAPNHYTISMNNKYMINVPPGHNEHNNNNNNNNSNNILNGSNMRRQRGGGTPLTGPSIDPSIISNASLNKSNRISIRSNTAAPLTSFADVTTPMTGVQVCRAVK